MGTVSGIAPLLPAWVRLGTPSGRRSGTTPRKLDGTGDRAFWPCRLVSTAGTWRVVADIGRLPHVGVQHAQFRHYGSGYASYVDVFVARRGGPDIEGLCLALCRFAPFAALFQPGIRSSSFQEMPQLGRVAMATSRDGKRNAGWSPYPRPARHRLARLTDTRPSLGPAAPVKRVFDAWFHWID